MAPNYQALVIFPVGLIRELPQELAHKNMGKLCYLKPALGCDGRGGRRPYHHNKVQG